MNVEKMNAIQCLGNWEVSIWDNDLSTIIYHSNGENIAKPSDFPSDADINARVADMQTKADTGNFTDMKAIIASY
jgi:hypothetical protein